MFRFDLEQIPQGIADFTGYNVAELFSASDLAKIGDEVVRAYEKDRSDCSKRHDAMRRFEKLYEMSEESFRTTSGDRGRVYPTLTSAVNEFCAAASAVFPYERPVRSESRSDIPSAEKAKFDVMQALQSSGAEQGELDLDAIASQAIDKARLDKMIAEEQAEGALQVLNYQFSEENQNWIDEVLSSFGVLAIKGCFLRRVGFDPQEHLPMTELIDPCDVVVNKRAKNCEAAERISVIKQYSFGEIEIEISEKRFVSFDIFKETNDEQKYSEDLEKNFEVIECVGRADFDGDGFGEPYVFWVDRETRSCIRIERNYYNNEIMKIEDNVVKLPSKPRFILYNFLPDYSGGFFGRGLGDMLEQPTKTLSALVTVTMQAAIKSTLGGGLIDIVVSVSGEIQAGKYTKAKVLSGNLATAIAPFPVSEPSQVIVQMIELYQSSVNRLANISGFDPAEMPANMPAMNMAMIASKSMEKFTAVFRNYLRSFTREIDAFVKCNAEYFLSEKYSQLLGVVVEKEQFSNQLVKFSPAIDIRTLTVNDKMILSNYLNEKTEDPFFDPMKIRREALLNLNVRDPESYIKMPPASEAPVPDPMVEAQVAMLQAQTEALQGQAKRSIAEAERTQEKTEDEVIGLKTKSIKDLADAEAKEVGMQNELYMAQRLKLTERENNERGMDGLIAEQGDEEIAGGNEHFGGEAIE